MGTMRSNPGQTTTAYGTATSDSENGLVMVDMGGDTVSPDDDQSIECETTFKVYKGDEVIVSLVGADGSGKTPIVIGVVGRGDEQQSEIDGMKNYFWVNDRGAHISIEEQSVARNNVLVDADSLDIRYGNSNSEDDQILLARFGRNNAYIGGVDGTPYWRIKDLRSGATGTAIIEDIKYGDGSETSFTTDFTVDSIRSVTVNGTAQTEDEDYTFDSETSSITFTTAPGVSSLILIEYETSDGVFSYSEGIRGNGTEGPYSKVTGLNNIASGSYSQAHGNSTVADGWCAIADGYGTIAASRLQKVSGRLNVSDSDNKYAEIVGNGTNNLIIERESFNLNGSTSEFILSRIPYSVNSAVINTGNIADYMIASVDTSLYTNSGMWYLKTTFKWNKNPLSNHVFRARFVATVEFDHYVSGSQYPTRETIIVSVLNATVGPGINQLVNNRVLVSASDTISNVAVISFAINIVNASIRREELSVNETLVGVPEYVSEIPNGSIEIIYRYVNLDRKNAYNLDWNGNAEFKGAVFVGGCTPNGETPHSVVRFNTNSYNIEYCLSDNNWKALYKFYKSPYIYSFGWDPDGEIDGVARTDAVQGEGIITDTGKEIRLTFTLPGSLDLVNSVDITDMIGGMRGIKGYINSTAYNTDWLTILEGSGYTYDTHIQGNLLVLRINKTSAFSNYTNNTPIIFSPLKITLTCN